MEKIKFETLEKDFLSLVETNYPKTAGKIKDAYFFAKNAHEGVKRKSGEPYIVHPLSVSKILIENNMDYATIIAGLLHDVVEDTEITLDEIRDKFGEVVAKLVDGVTKISAIKLQQENLTEADSMKRLIVAMGNDVRVIFIKLADRVHNMRTIEFLARDKQIKMAEETRELFIPIADRIGIRKIRSELEALVLRCLEPEQYDKIEKEINKKFNAKKEVVERAQNDIHKILADAKINSSVSYWKERVYSVYKKMDEEGFSKIQNIYFFKIIVPTEIDCYIALGLLHKHYSVLPGQIQDFIASPKANGYRSLQSLLVDYNENINLKVMIRTEEMDKICEYGISSLWYDKDSEVVFSENIEKYNNLKEIVSNEDHNLTSTRIFLDAIKTDLDSNSTWVFTPKFKPICLNADKPTAIDLAYAVHSKIGDNAVEAIINGKRAALSSELSAGDVVEIVTSEQKKAPSREWLSVVKTSNARKKIREYLNKHTTPKNVEEGKRILEAELEKLGHKIGDVLACYDEIKKEFNFVSLDDMYASIGYGSITTGQITKYATIVEEQSKCERRSPVKVDGSVRFLSLSFPRCCSAIPGDRIVAVYSKNAISVHRSDCKNLLEISDSSKFAAQWKPNLKQLFKISIIIVAKDRVGVAGKIFDVISGLGHNVSKTEIKNIGGGDCEFDLSMELKDTDQLSQLFAALKSVKEIKRIMRSGAI